MMPFLLMFCIAFSLRVLPFLFSNTLQKWRGLEKIGILLPTCILILLVAHTLGRVSFGTYPFGLPELLAITTVVVSQITLRSIILSMAVGIACHQLFLRLL